jgi:hypothetical protein
MIPNKRELGLAGNMVLLHNGLGLLLPNNLMFWNKNMIERIIDKMEDTEEAHIDAFGDEEGQGQLMVDIHNGFHHHHNRLGQIGGRIVLKVIRKLLSANLQILYHTGLGILRVQFLCHKTQTRKTIC